jgi:superfamily II DNA helicase RecQ
MIFMLSDGKMVPRQPQLVGALATLAGRDSKVILGTRSGKTLIMVLPHLLQPDRISIVVSPLKCLQVTQVRRTTRSSHSRDANST